MDAQDMIIAEENRIISARIRIRMIVNACNQISNGNNAEHWKHVLDLISTNYGRSEDECKRSHRE